MAEFVEVMKEQYRMCNSFSSCSEGCPLNNLVSDVCVYWIRNNPQEAEEIIMKWAKEHPIKTNVDKFKEVFGREPSKKICVFLDVSPSSFCSNNSCNKCELKDFWNQEYKEQK